MIVIWIWSLNLARSGIPAIVFSSFSPSSRSFSTSEAVGEDPVISSGSLARFGLEADCRGGDSEKGRIVLAPLRTPAELLCIAPGSRK